MTIKVFLVAIEAYLLGSIPFGFILYRFREGGDVRMTGSGNIGATNVLRGAGVAAGVATLALDGAKGFAAVALAGAITGHAPEWTGLAAVLAVLGHIFPVFLKFRGGKGVATGFGAFLMIAPLPILGVALLFAVVVALSRYVSLASITAVAAFPVMLVILDRASPYTIAAAVVCALLIVSRHSSNIHRLIAGEELRMGR